MTTNTDAEQVEDEQGSDLSRFSNVESDGGDKITVTTELYKELMEEWAAPHDEWAETEGYDYVTFSKTGNPELYGYGDVPASTWSSTSGAAGVTLADHGTSQDWEGFREDVEMCAKRLEDEEVRE